MRPNPESPFQAALCVLTQGPRLWGTTALIACLSAVAFLLVVSTFDRLTADEPWRPLYGAGYDKLQPTQEVIIAAGDVLHVTATKCSHQEVDVYGYSTWLRVAPSVLRIPNGLPLTRVRPEGCETTVYENQVPADLAPGVWQLEGTETAIDGAREYRVVWSTQRFTVVPAERPAVGQ